MFKSYKIIWECSECGTRNERDFSLCDLTCEACGANEFEFGNTEARYSFNAFQATKNLPDSFSETPFACAKACPERYVELIRSKFPQFNSREIWSGFAVFDLIWMSVAQPELIWILPFEVLTEDIWNDLWPCCKHTAYFVKRFISSRSVKWLQVALSEGKLSLDDLRSAIKYYSEQDWFGTDAEVLTEVALFIRNLVSDNKDYAAIVSELPKIIQYEIWQICPECVGLPNGVLRDMDTDAAIKFLADEAKRDKILKFYPFEKFTADNWRKAVRIVANGPTARFKEELWKGWVAANFSDDEIYDILLVNPAAYYLLPFDRFTPSQFIYLLPIVQVEDFDLSAYCPFEKMTNNDWVQLLHNPRIRYSEYIFDAIHAFGISARLSRPEILRILDENPNAIAYLNIENIPVDKAVEIYLEYPEVVLPSTLIFKSCTKEQAKQLLCECGNRIPLCAKEMLRSNSIQAFSTEELNEMLSENLSLGIYLPSERIRELSPKVFCDLAIKYYGAKFLTLNYDLRCLESDSVKQLVKAYPWISERLDMSDWSVEDVVEIANVWPKVIARYPHKLVYFIYVHPIAMWTAILFCALSLIALLFALVTGGVGCLINALR